MQELLVKDVQEYFKYQVVTGDESSLTRKIEVADVNRPGLELTGYFDYSQPKRVVILGDKEINYINNVMSHEQQIASFEFLTSENTPMILISRNHECPRLLMDIATRKNFPIFTSYAPTSSLITEMVSYLEEQLALFENVHGVLLDVHGVGVLIMGDSGMGKSEIALELIKKGHILVADDRVDVSRVHNRVLGETPEILRDMLEIRGIGIINVAQMFGITASMPKCNINLVVQLEKWNDEKEYARVGNEEKQYQHFFGIDVPKVVLPVREGRSMGAIIESAVTNYILLQRGIDSSKDFENRIYDFIKNKNGSEE